jgi:hypothetical protein
MDTNEKPAMLEVQHISQAAIRTDIVDTHVNQMALPALWEKSYLCPCRDRATRQPDQTCQVCHGRGIAYMSPKNFTIIIQSQEKGVFNADLGLMDSGTAIGTPDRSVRIAFRDRITVPSAKVSQSFILDCTTRRVDKGFYMVYDVHEIEFATTINKELVEGVDYTVDLDKNLFFPMEHLLGENISINILTTLRYMVADLLKEHRYARDRANQLIKLPQKLLLKREDLFIDKEAFESDVEKVGFVDTKRSSSTTGINGFFMGSGE